MTRLVQLQNGAVRAVARVEEPNLRLLSGPTSVHALATEAVAGKRTLAEQIERRLTQEAVDYDAVYRGESPWRLLCPADHPDDPSRCLVSGTGLTHLGSAKHRAAMHSAVAEETDSMRMFRWGVEGGRPAPGVVGIAPEWFFKGVGTVLRRPGDALPVPPYAEDGGEEAELAGIYMIDADGQPRRIGMANGNEFSDHRFEKRNYLNLAGSKLRPCSFGPELVIDPEFSAVAGQVTLERAGRIYWHKAIASGEKEMCHSLANLEHHHFKFEGHRRPGDLHVHYYGAHSLSFGDGVILADGDVMVVEFQGFGRALRNPLKVAGQADRVVTVRGI